MIFFSCDLTEGNFNNVVTTVFTLVLWGEAAAAAARGKGGGREGNKNKKKTIKLWMVKSRSRGEEGG